jgi:hypothetical protein
VDECITTSEFGPAQWSAPRLVLLTGAGHSQGGPAYSITENDSIKVKGVGTFAGSLPAGPS